MSPDTYLSDPWRYFIRAYYCQDQHSILGSYEMTVTTHFDLSFPIMVLPSLFTQTGGKLYCSDWHVTCINCKKVDDG